MMRKGKKIVELQHKVEILSLKLENAQNKTVEDKKEISILQAMYDQLHEKYNKLLDDYEKIELELHEKSIKVNLKETEEDKESSKKKQSLKVWRNGWYGEGDKL